MTSKITVANKSIIGILGGTFDPIHYGHINCAIDIAKQLNLTTVQLLPAHIPPHKKSLITAPEHRLAMCKLVCTEFSLFQTNTVEIAHDNPSYTVNTLQAIRSENLNTSLCFFIGMDSLLTLTSWYNWQKLLTLCHLIVSTRPGYSINNMPSEIKNLLEKHQTHDVNQLQQNDAGFIYFNQITDLDISSSDIRERLNKNLSCQNLLPASVLRYIKQHSLYQ